MSRAERLLSLVQVLRRHRHPVNASALAEELGVSIRSVYRDVESLRNQGASIEGEAGVGYLLRPGFLLPPLMFTHEELEALVLGLRLAAEHGDPGLGRAAVEVTGKLRSVLPRELRELVDETSLLAGPALERPADGIDLALVRRTLRDGRKASVDYVNGQSARSTRTIWPLALAFFQRSRVVVAWCEQRRDFRMFRTDRLSAWVPLPERLPRPRLTLLREWREREAIPAQLPE